MARPKKKPPPPPPPSLGEALLLATMCMVGLPVEAQVRDGSAYAGVFHTACVDGGYGVVLKKARKIANGEDDANVSLGAFVDTLVILPNDLVQVIAKDFSLPTKDVCRTPDCDFVRTRGSAKPQNSHAKDPKTSRTENISPKRVEICSSQSQEDDISIGKSASMNCNITNRDSTTGYVEPQLSWNEILSSAKVASKDGNVTNSVSSTPTVVPDVKTFQLANNSATKIAVSSKTTSKESKLNPCAKVFSPSFGSSRPVFTAAPSVNSNYISNSVTEVPTGVPVFETNSVPGSSSLPSKLVHYNNLVPANYGIPPQYVQSIVGHNVARLDHARTATPYHPMQVGSSTAYFNPSPQPVVGGKPSPVVYVHPVPQDASQGWSCAVLSNSYHSSLQKFQGTAPVYVAPPVMATGNLPLVMPSPAPLVQPFQVIHPIMVPAASSIIPGKYM